ncbi:MAG: hypothetical protein ACI9WT_000550 [Flavobacterium sp.]|jgi:hypothetical protein
MVATNGRFDSHLLIWSNYRFNSHFHLNQNTQFNTLQKRLEPLKILR